MGLSHKGRIQIFLLFLLAFCASGSQAENFKITAPPAWQNVETTSDSHIYKNIRSKNQQYVMTRTIAIEPKYITTFQKLIHNQIPNVAKARERLLSKLGVFNYSINAHELRKLKNSSFSEMFVLQSRFNGYRGEEVQVLERQYLNGNQLFQTLYFEESPALNNRIYAENVLDNFKPIYQSSRAPASNELVNSGFSDVEACGEVCELDKAWRARTKVWWYPPGDKRCERVAQERPQDLHRTEEALTAEGILKGTDYVGKDCAKGILDGLQSALEMASGALGAVAQLSDINGSSRRRARGEELVLGEKSEVYKINRNQIAQSKRALPTYEDVIQDAGLKPLNQSELQMEMASGASLAKAQLAKFLQKPGEAVGQVMLGLAQSVGESVSEFRCLKLEKQLSILCQAIATTVPPGSVYAKFARGTKVTTAEVAPIVKATQNALSKENVVSKEAALVKAAPAGKTAEQLAKNIEDVSARYIGKPYEGGYAGDGPRGVMNSNPIVCLNKFDCTTFVESVAALSRADSAGGFKVEAARIRYHNGAVKYEERKHFAEYDWIPGNVKAGIISDITEDIAGSNVKVVKDVIDRDKWLHTNYDEMIAKIRKQVTEDVHAGHNRELVTAEGNKKIKEIEELKKKTPASTPTPVQLSYVPIETLLNDAATVARIPSGSVFSMVRSGTTWQFPNGKMGYVGTVVSHQGFLIRKDGKMYIRHASSVQKQIVDEPLDDYLRLMREGNPTYVGLNITRINPRTP